MAMAGVEMAHAYVIVGGAGTSAISPLASVIQKQASLAVAMGNAKTTFVSVTAAGKGQPWVPLCHPRRFLQRRVQALL